MRARRADERDHEQGARQPDRNRRDRNDYERQTRNARGAEENRAVDYHADQGHDARRGQGNDDGKRRKRPFHVAFPDRTVSRPDRPESRRQRQISQSADDRRRRPCSSALPGGRREAHESTIHTYDLAGN